MFKGLEPTIFGASREPTMLSHGRQWKKLPARDQQKRAFLLSRLGVKYHHQCLAEQKMEGKSLSNTELQSDHTSMTAAECVYEGKESSHVGSLGWFSYPGRLWRNRWRGMHYSGV